MNILPSWAVPGRKVVCVNDLPKPNNIKRLEKGRVYTIDNFVYWPESSSSWAFHLKEINRPASTKLGVVVPWGSWRFRPVITLEEDMLTFRSLLNSVPSNPNLETTNVE